MSVVFYDQFIGTTIDTSKWTETDPNSIISQNGSLSLALSNTTNISEFVNKLESVSSITSGTSIIQGLLDWTDGGNNEPIAGMYLWKNNSNYAYIGARSGGGTYRIRIYSGGTQVYSLESTVTNGKDVKIVNTGTTVAFYYWSGSAWVQIGVTTTVSLGYNIKYVISLQDFNTTSGANPTTIDNAYFCNADYSTQYPPTIYTLACAYATFTLTGYTAALKRIIKELLSYGSYTLTGQSLLFKKIKTLLAEFGAYTLTGQNILFHRINKIVLAFGSFALTGINVIFIKGRAIIMSTGTFAVTGSDLLFHRLMHVVLNYGSFSLSGIVALFHKVTNAAFSFGSFVLNGQDVLFHRVRKLISEVGTFNLTGQVAMFHKRISLFLSLGVFNLTGFSMSLHRAYHVCLSAGNFALSGFALAFKGFGNWLWRRGAKDDGAWTKTPKE